MRGNRNTGSKQGKNLRRLATDLLFDTRRKPQAKIVVQRKWLFVLRRLSTIRKFLTVDGTLTRKWDQEHSCQHPKKGRHRIITLLCPLRLWAPDISPTSIQFEGMDIHV